MTEATSDDQPDGAGHEETRSDTGNAKPDERQSAYFLTPEQIWDPLFGPSGPQEDSIEKIEQKIFLRLLEATRNILSPKVFYFCHDTGSHLKKKIRIAVNTREIPIKPKSGPEARQKKWVLEQRALDKKDSKQTQLHRIEGAPIEDWQRQFSDDLREMASARQERSTDDSGPDFICFPEFSFPFEFPWQRGKKGKKKKGESEVFFDGEIEAIARSTNRFFFFGSAHDQQRLKNTGAVCAFGPHAPLPRKEVFDSKFKSIRHLPEFNGLVFSVIGDEPSQQVVVNVGPHPPISTRAELQRALKEGQITKAQKDTIRDAFDYFDSIAAADSEIITINKKAAAIKLTEYLEPEGNPSFEIFVTPHGVVSVLICYDAYDPSVFLTATRLYQHSKIRNGRFLHHGVDIFIVPSYNSSPQLVRMCESLSYLTNTVVVYLSGDPRCTTKAEVFVCGRSVDLCHMQMGAEDSEFFKRWKNSDQQITYFEIDSDLLTFAMRFRQNKLGILGLGASEMAVYKPLGRDALG